ncbi:KAP family P-loop NTPase fold protein [Sphingobacterium detergens]
MKSKNITTVLLFKAIIIVTILILFRDPVAILINTIFVKPVFSKTPNSNLTTILVIILSLTTIVKLWKTKMYPNFIQLSIAIIAFYFIQRFNPFWNFYAITEKSWLYIWDIAFISLLILYFKDLKMCTEEKKEKEDKKKSIWIEDLPIDSLEEDTFRRTHFAKELAEQLEKKNSKKSFVIGIVGEYGSGKSSFINLIKTHLDRQKVEIIEFDAWRSKKAENIHLDFFDHLANELSNSSNNISQLITSYSKKLSRIDSSLDKVFKRIGVLNQLVNNFQSDSDEYGRINEILKESNKKLIVIIDDLDRLYSNEIIEVLRLVRNTANFTNTFYLLAYEKSYIQVAIKEELHINNSTYMDKIVQLEIPLPKREHLDLLILTKQLLKENISVEELDILNNSVFNKGFNKDNINTFHEIFRNARDIIKFMNAFLLSYTLLKSEVPLDKLFLVELLKYRFPEFYERLYQHRDDFLSTRSKRNGFLTMYELRQECEKALNPGQIQYSFYQYLTSEKYHIDDIKIINALMLALFTNESWPNFANNSIVNPNSFERYFRFRLSSDELSEVNFQKAWKEESQDLSKYINKCSEENLITQLLTRLLLVEPKNTTEFELLIRAIFQAGPLYETSIKDSYFDIDALIDILLNYPLFSATSEYNEKPKQYINLLNELFYSAPFPYTFHSRLIWHINIRNEKLLLSTKELIDYQVIYFCEYVRLKGFDSVAIDLMWNTRIEKPNQEKVNKNERDLMFPNELKLHIIEFLTLYDPAVFLKDSIDVYGGGYKINEEVLSIFDSSQQLFDIVKMNKKLNAEMKNEYLMLLEKLMIDNFTSAVLVFFKTDIKPTMED